MNFWKRGGKKIADRKGVISEYLPWLLIALAILVILMVAIFTIKGTGSSLIDKIKSIIGG